MTFKRTIITATVAVSLLTGCATVKQQIVPHLQVVDAPPIGQVRSVELGDTLVAKGKIYTFDAIRLENTVSAGDGFLLKKFTIEPGVLVASLRDDERIFYGTDRLQIYDAILGTKNEQGGLAFNLTDTSDVKFYWNGRLMLRPHPTPVVIKTTVSAVNRPSFKQELIYNGRSGDTLKFLYREFSNDVVRAPFTQEIQYDLKDGHTIGFKSVRIEVINATNTTLKYKVLVSFPDSL